MTVTEKTELICNCGHSGNIVCKRSDPGDPDPWEICTLNGFNGNSLTLNNHVDRGDLIDEMKPVCPKCGFTPGLSV